MLKVSWIISLKFLKSYFKYYFRTSAVVVPADISFNEATAWGESPEGAIKVHYFNNRTDSSEPAASDDRKQHLLAAGQAVKKCRNPVFPIIGCVPAVFLAQCSYPLQWIYSSLSPTTHLPRFHSVSPTLTRFFKLGFLPAFVGPITVPYVRLIKLQIFICQISSI